MGGVVIIGAGLAGLRTAEELRARGYSGGLTIVGAEQHPPYTRPPLSKDVLRGESLPTSAHLREESAYAELDVDLVLGRAATRLDVVARSVVLDNGDALPYDACVIATGATPRRLPGTEGLAGVHVLRTIDDAIALRDALAMRPRVVVVGAGFIGSEVASSARTLGCDVTVVEIAEAPLVHALGRELGAACAALQEASGVALRCGVGVDSVIGDDAVKAVRLADGTEIPADIVVVGLGVTPNVEWLDGSGLTVDNGIVCDEHCRTSDPSVWAVGDVARFYNPLFDEAMRIEHWTNAGEAAIAAARSILGDETPFAPVPYVWSDQFGTKIQVLGRPRGDDHCTIAHGSLDSGRFVALLGRGGRLTGVVGFRWPAKVMSYRSMLATPTSYDDALAHAEESS